MWFSIRTYHIKTLLCILLSFFLIFTLLAFFGIPQKNVQLFESKVIRDSEQIIEESQSNPLKYYQNNVEGTRTLLQAAVKNNLKEIIFYTNSEIKDAKIKLRIFHFKDSLPTYDMIDEDLVVTVKKGNRKNVLDVSKYKINFPKTGIVIGMEWLIIEENKYQFTYFDPKKKTKISNDSYAPNLVINYSKTENSFNYRGKWYKQKKHKTKVIDQDETVITPAINLVLTN